MKGVTVIIIGIIVMAVGFFAYKNFVGGGLGAGNRAITTSELSLHSEKDDCWLAIDGVVYDVTKFIPIHPGKEKILMGCGRDATELFNTKGNPDSGMTHSDKARAILMSLAKVGKLSQN